MRDTDERYFERLETELDEAFAVANEARERGGDPQPEVEIPVAKDMADRVENILGIDGVAERVRELEGEMSREEAALELVDDFVEGTVGDYETRAGKVEGAVRTAVALLTEGVVAAPIEGIDRVELLENDDGTEFINVYYAGPIRSAGGTAQALSVLVADYARALLDIDEYKAREDEIGRYAEEVALYDEETGLQYAPKEKEAQFIARHMPIMLDGEATGDEEVSGYRDLERVETNSARGGMCLVLGEGIALKAPKIQRYTRDLDEIDWPWLQDLIDGNYKNDGGTKGDGDDESETADDESGESDGSDGESDDTDGESDDTDGESEGDTDESGDDSDGGSQDTDSPAGPPRLDPSKKFLQDLIAGRPVFSHPSESGGFRLRYGRARNHGHATAGIHPATMHLVDDFLAPGTQIKTERPGKAAGIVPVDTIEGPTVRLANGDVRRIDDAKEAVEIRNGVERILDLGEYLVNYGEFVENNHPLAPASYTVEWWEQEFEKAGGPVQALRDSTAVDLTDPSPEEALQWAIEYDAPLHPAYTYVWHDVTVEQVTALAAAIDDGRRVAPDGATETTGGHGDSDRTEMLVVDRTETVRRTLERLLVEHTQHEDTLSIPVWEPLVRTLGFDTALERSWSPADLSERACTYDDGENAIEAINEIAPFAVRERAPTRIGNRMGRPEKSEERELSPAVHTLFPIDEAGGSQRSVEEATQHGDAVEGTKGEIEVEVGRRECRACGERTYWSRCPDCGDVAEAVYVCPDCESDVEPDESGRAECDRCEILAYPTQYRTIDVGDVLEDALDNVGERTIAFDTLKAVEGLTSEEKTPEPVEKGILRAKHDVSAFKDGTIRYDMTDLPVTAVRPDELDVTVEQFRELGYHEDIRGDPLEHAEQVVELRVQDVVLSDGAAAHLLRTADFVDDLLTQYYGLEPYYELEDRDDLVGELVFGMAPHTSAATVGRVVGFTSAAVGYAHPYFHAAKRRNCFHPETNVWYRDEDGSWHHDRIEQLVEDRLDSPTEDDFGTKIQELDADLSVPSLTADGTQTIQRVDAVSKHPSPEHLIQIETRGGRTLRVTPDHELIRQDNTSARTQERDRSERTQENQQAPQSQENSTLQRVKATEINVGDTLLSPAQISYAGKRDSIDLLERFIASDVISNEELIVRDIGSETLRELFREQTPGDAYAGPTAEQRGVSSSAVDEWVRRGSVPVDQLLAVFGRETLPTAVPDDVTITRRGDTAEIERHLPLDDSMARLLGYYVAAGSVSTTEGSPSQGSSAVSQTTIDAPSQSVRESLVTTFEEILGVEADEANERDIAISSRLVAVLFAEIFGAGEQSDEKRIPDCLFGTPRQHLRAFLAAYFVGSGQTTTDPTAVRAHTRSDALKTDLQSALKRFGITVTATQESRTTATGDDAEVVPDETGGRMKRVADETGGQIERAPNESPGSELWLLTLTGDDVRQFAEQIGFALPRKQRQLEAILESSVSPPQRLRGDGGDVHLDEVVAVDFISSDCDFTYCLTVADTNTLVANDLISAQCDGDEDCVMLLLDGLLNFSKVYLPDKRGGSVAEDSRLVTISPDGDVQFMTFGEFWNELDAPVEQDGKFRKRTCVNEGWQTYAFDHDHVASPQPIEKAIRYRASENEQVLRVETQFGRSIEITEDHSLFRYDDGIEEIAGADLSEGDLVVAPRNLSIESQETTFDVVECLDDPYVVIDDHVEDLLTTAWETTEQNSQTRQAFLSGLAYRLDRKKIGYDRLQEILTTAGFDIPETLEIGLKGSENGINRKIDLDEDFAWLLGLFVAEGTLSSICPAIHNSDETVVENAVEKGRHTLGCEPQTRWSNKSYEVRFPAVFRELLYSLGFQDCKEYSSSEKIIPECILTAPRELVLAFLRGFMTGDGSMESNDNNTTLGFHTTSEEVKDGIVYLLHRLGLVANISCQERDEPRQPLYNVTVSGGAKRNSLRKILNGEESYHPKSLVVSIPDALFEIRDMDIPDIKQLVPKYLKRRENISLEKLREIVIELESRDLPDEATDRLTQLQDIVDGDLSYLRIQNIERIDYDGYLYDLQVGGEPIFTANWLYAHNSMDAPLVMSSRIDPAEIDDEAHNVDIMQEYPLAFYEATRELAEPGDVEDMMTIAEETLGTEHEYTGFRHTHETTDIAAGPDLSAYKTLGSMEDKMDAQLLLSRKLRAVDETDVAERIIEFHFLPDLLGNLKAFSSQEVRCLDCSKKYRRAPLSGECRECGGNVTLTVHEGSVNKYMDTALQVAEEFGCRDYTKQRLKILEKRIERIFEDDTNKQSGIADFM